MSGRCDYYDDIEILSEGCIEKCCIDCDKREHCFISFNSMEDAVRYSEGE